MLRPGAVLLALGCVFLAGCGAQATSGATSTQAATSKAPSAGSLEALWRSAPAHASVVAGTTDYQPGSNRVSFLLVDSQGRVLSPATAKVWVATSLQAKPYQSAVARSEPIGVPGGASAGVGSIFVTHLDLPRAGKYWMLASPVGGGKPNTALANLVVAKKPESPGVGARAVSTDTPTLASTGGKLARLTTATHPDPRLYRVSVAQAMARHDPFVVTFATPKFCQS